MSVLIKNVKGSRNDCYSLRIYSWIVVQWVAVKPGQRMSGTDPNRLTGAGGFRLALDLGQQAVKCHKLGLRLCVHVWRGHLYFNSAILIDAAMCTFKNVLFTNVILLSRDLCAAWIYSGFISISAASQVLGTPYPVTHIPASLDLYRGLLEKMKPLFLLIAKLYNAGSCSVAHCWVHFF